MWQRQGASGLATVTRVGWVPIIQCLLLHFSNSPASSLSALSAIVGSTLAHECVASHSSPICSLELPRAELVYTFQHLVACHQLSPTLETHPV